MTNSISIVATTYAPDGPEGAKRLAAFTEAVISWSDHLKFDGAIDLIVADDGSGAWFDGLRMIQQSWTRNGWITRENARGVGGSLNRGFKIGFDQSSVVLYAVDDWALLHDFDITPWVQLLDECEDVGVVRLGPPHPGNVLRARPYTSNWQGWAARIAPMLSEGIIVSERPALWHKRMIDHVGWFKEDCTALECERDYDERFKQLYSLNKLDVVLALPHPWMHLNPSEMSNREPSQR